MVIIGPKVNVAVARSALQSEVKTITQRKEFVQRSQSARSQLYQFQKDDVSSSAKYNNYEENDGYEETYRNQQRSIRRQQKENHIRGYKPQRQQQGYEVKQLVYQKKKK